MARGIPRDFEEGLEDVDDNLLKVLHQFRRFVHIEETRNLDQPSDVRGEELVIDNPGRELIPLLEISTIDGYTPFYHLVLASLEIGNDFFGNLGQVASMNEVVCFQKDGSKS